jgi:hypothetical protein
MSKRALIWIRVAWIVATIVLMFAWREEALVLFVPLAFLGPLLRETVPPRDQDERERTVDYRASHFALMTVFAVLFLLFAKAQVVDGTGISPDLMLLLAAPLIVRVGLAIGRTSGGRRLGLAIGFTMGGIWLAFTLVSHGLSVASLAEASIGGGILLATAVGLRRPRLGGGLLVAVGIALFALDMRRGNWEMAITMALILTLPPVLAGLALLASAQKAAAEAIDEFADLRPAGSRSPRQDPEEGSGR